MAHTLKGLLSQNSSTEAFLFVNDDGEVCARDEDGTEHRVCHATYVTFPQIRIGAAPTAPDLIEAGPTLGWLFAIGDFAYCEVPFHPQLDTTKPVIIGLSYAPSGNEAGKLVSWDFAVVVVSEGKSVIAADVTLHTGDLELSDTAGVYEHASVSLPASYLDTHDEIHFRITRIASAADPVNPPGLHHVVVIQQLK